MISSFRVFLYHSVLLFPSFQSVQIGTDLATLLLRVHECLKYGNRRVPKKLVALYQTASHLRLQYILGRLKWRFLNIKDTTWKKNSNFILFYSVYPSLPFFFMSPSFCLVSLSCLVSMVVNCPGCMCSCLVGIVAILWVLVVLCVCIVLVLVVLCVYCVSTCCSMCVLLSYLLFYVCSVVVLVVICVYCCRTCCSMCVLLYLFYYMWIPLCECRWFYSRSQTAG